MANNKSKKNTSTKNTNRSKTNSNSKSQVNVKKSEIKNTELTKEETVKKEIPKEVKKNILIMKFLTFLGIVVFFIALVYLMNYFFVEKSYLQINMSTDKKLEYMTFNGKEELVPTQKYVSDLNYSMRYDVDKVTVFKYKKQDIFKFIDAEKILVVIEHSDFPSRCNVNDLENDQNNCTVRVNDYTLEYYIQSGQTVFKITIKTPNGAEEDETNQKRIDYMINSFTPTN